jgi:hypothetical protein
MCTHLGVREGHQGSFTLHPKVAGSTVSNLKSGFRIDSTLSEEKARDEKKMIVGDNLASHISSAVIQACKDHDSQGEFLVPTSSAQRKQIQIFLHSD